MNVITLKRTRCLVLGTGLLALFGQMSAAPLAWAQTPQTAPQTAPAIPAGADDYILGVDDILDIEVPHHPNLNRQGVIVRPDGRISFGMAGEIAAKGKTPRQLGKEIQTKLEETLNNAEVSVSVRSVVSRKVKVSGAVRVPGTFDVKNGWRVLDVVAVAGGLATKAKWVKGQLIRLNGTVPEVTKVDLVEAQAHPDGPANLPIKTDDLLLLEPLDPTRSTVAVIGEVLRPGSFDWDEESTLLTMLSQAGGPTQYAALSKAHILRKGEKIPLNLLPILQKGATDPEVTGIKLQDKDTLIIPTIEDKYAVMGGVNRPGYYAIPEKDGVTILQALALAGGSIPGGGEEKKAVILHMKDGKPTYESIDLEKMQKKGLLAQNRKLEKDEILYIPMKGNSKKFEIQDVLGPLSTLSFLGLRIFK